jgi:plasmid maintenance system antidote protein VapI
VKTNVQSIIENQRSFYENLGRPLLQYVLEVYGLSIRDFAGIFSISLSHAEDIVKHRVFPSLELAIRIARYWECSTDDLFAWRVDDDGGRYPLLISLPGREGSIRLSTHRAKRNALPLVKDVALAMKSEDGIVELERKLKGGEK